MPGKVQRVHSGYVLLLMLVVLMGLGGVVAAGYTQGVKKDAEHERYLHNQRVLREAKRALLQYAYNYPLNNAEGPGRLPCPDDNDDGLTGPLSLALCTSVGRLPWAEPDLNFFDARDASGQRLWYAVSNSFYNLGGGPIVNSNSTGSITVIDQAGNLIYDGATDGVAAVIFAPGPITSRDEDSNGTYEYVQLRGTPIQRNDPRNYLDTIGGFDNAVFNNLESDTDDDGFILGPVVDPNAADIVINDQMIVITSDEVIAMAEKATLQAYRESLRNYSARVATDVAAPPAPWTGYYPWLFNYTVDDLDVYPSDPAFATERANSLTNVGRVPSIYADYFTETTSQPIESELAFNFNLIYPVTPTTVGYDQITPVIATGVFRFNNAAQHSFNETTLPQTIAFVDIADVVGDDGRLAATAITNQTYQVDLWFWDENALGPPTGVWTSCPFFAGDENDCNRDAAGNPTPGSPSNLASVEVLRVIAEVDFSGTVNFDIDFSTPAVITATGRADGSGHATLQAVIAAGDVIDLPVTLSYEIDRFYETSFDIQETGTLVIGDLALGNLTLGLRYYPELPPWIFSNDWHSSVQFAYAPAYLPDQVGAAADCIETVDCVEIIGQAGNADNKKSLLVIAGEHDWVDGDAAPQPPDPPDTLFDDELDDLFNPENADLDRIFDIRTVEDPLALGDTELDRALVMEEL